jgi:hypothetical protein
MVPRGTWLRYETLQGFRTLPPPPPTHKFHTLALHWGTLITSQGLVWEFSRRKVALETLAVTPPNYNRVIRIYPSY